MMGKFRFVVVFLALMICSYPVFAGVRAGLRGGVNLVNNDITEFNEEKVLDGDSYTGYYVGLAVQIGQIGGFGLDMSALYSQKGLKLSGEDNFRQQSIAVPVMLDYSMGLGNIVGIFVQAGPQMNLNIGDTEKMIVNAAKDMFRSFEMEKCVWSFNVGAGVKLLRNWQVAVNYNMPLSNDGVNTLFRRVDDIGNPLDAGLVISDYARVADKKFKSSTLQLSVTYLF